MGTRACLAFVPPGFDGCLAARCSGSGCFGFSVVKFAEFYFGAAELNAVTWVRPRSAGAYGRVGTWVRSSFFFWSLLELACARGCCGAWSFGLGVKVVEALSWLDAAGRRPSSCWSSSRSLVLFWKTGQAKQLGWRAGMCGGLHRRAARGHPAAEVRLRRGASHSGVH